MNSSAEPGWLAPFIRASAATGKVLGIAVGGSHGRGTADGLSDVDLFFLVTPEELTALYRTPPDHLTDLLPGRTAVTYPVLVPEFGLKYTVMSSEVGLCDLFFEDGSGPATPLREGTDFRWDPDGRFDALNRVLLAQSRRRGTRDAHAVRMAVQLASEYAGVTKSVARGRTVQARYRMSKVVNLLLGMRGSWWFSHCVADEALTDPAADLAPWVTGALAEERLRAAHRLLGEVCIKAVKGTGGLAAEVETALVSQLYALMEAMEGR
ncbi:nucleotidyltransferase domain-containing protein [Actinomadura luteofluorescens]|uniref:nucleotidyltransferase domain-containing protein n=1 Tax=Actinomadura luteofluorescens TaxID=46163 RepID=UPI003D915EC9